MASDDDESEKDEMETVADENEIDKMTPMDEKEYGGKVEEDGMSEGVLEKK